MADGVWLPADIDGQGSVRLMLFAQFRGHMHLTTSDYRRFRTSATIVGSHGVIGPDGQPIPNEDQPPTKPASGPEDSPPPQQIPQDHRP